MSKDGLCVIVTGSASGLGAATAAILAKGGARIVVNYSNSKAEAEATADLCRDAGAEVVVAQGDVARDEDCKNIVAAAAPWGRLDALINNAGIYRKLSFAEGDESLLDEVWAVNVKAPFRLIRLALPHLAKSGNGRIVNVASTDGKRYRDASVSIAYALSKQALVGLSHAARFAGWDEGVRVTALCPGATDTDLTRGLPGVASQLLSPKTLAEIVSLLLHLPNDASVAELVVNTRLESTL